MNLLQIRDEVLKELYDGYIVGGGGSIYAIEQVTNKYGINSHEIGSLLKSEGLLKEHQFRADSMVCSISITGIMKVDPYYFDNHISTIVSTLGVSGNDWTGVREMFEWEPRHDSRACDIVHVMENMGIVEVLYRDDVFVKLNLRGHEYYKRNKPHWGN